MTLTEFLLARIAEDEAEARDVKAIDDDVTTDSALFTNDHHHHGFNVGYSATRALAECEAKRRIVSDALVWLDGDDNDGTFSAVMARACYVRTLRLLARPYADHADYDPAWAWAV